MKKDQLGNPFPTLTLEDTFKSPFLPQVLTILE